MPPFITRRHQNAISSASRVEETSSSISGSGSGPGSASFGVSSDHGSASGLVCRSAKRNHNNDTTDRYRRILQDRNINRSTTNVTTTGNNTTTGNKGLKDRTNISDIVNGDGNEDHRLSKKVKREILHHNVSPSTKPHVDITFTKHDDTINTNTTKSNHHQMQTLAKQALSFPAMPNAKSYRSSSSLTLTQTFSARRKAWTFDLPTRKTTLNKAPRSSTNSIDSDLDDPLFSSANKTLNPDLIEQMKCIATGCFGTCFLAKHPTLEGTPMPTLMPTQMISQKKSATHPISKSKPRITHYCIKKIDKDESTDQGAIHLLQREIMIHSRISQPQYRHKHIVNLYDVAQDNDFVYMCLEHCEGGDLFHAKLQDFQYHQEQKSNLQDLRLGQNPDKGSGPMHLAEAACYIGQILSAVAYLHENYVYHRDIKPENILIMGRSQQNQERNRGCGRKQDYDYGTVKLCDFGYAIHATHDNNSSSSTWRCTRAGTAEYLPFEMVDYLPYSTNYNANQRVQDMKRKGVGFRIGPGMDQNLFGNPYLSARTCTSRDPLYYDVRYVDVWAIGILAYELVFGATPFFMESEEKASQKIIRGYYSKNEVTFDNIRKIDQHVIVGNTPNINVNTKAIAKRYHALAADDWHSFCDFVANTTKRKADKRMNAKQALDHSWMTST